MRVLYIVNATLLYGGATKSFLLLLEGMKRKGVTPYVVTPDGDGLCLRLKEMGIRYFVMPYRANTYPRYRSVKDLLLFFPRLFMRRLLSLRATRKVVSICKSENIDLIHTNVSVISIGQKAAEKLGIPHIYHFREYADKDFGEHYYPSKSLFRKSLDKPSSFAICITKDIQTYHKLSPQKSIVVYNGISIPKEVTPSALKDDYFLFAGRIESSKGVSQLIEAYHLCTQNANPCKLLLAGSLDDSQYVNAIKEQIKLWKLEENIEFLGQRSDIANLMKQAKALIVTSHNEAFGRSMAEAMANQCLVIGRDTGGTKEQFDNGKELTGHEIGIRFNTTEELSKALTSVNAKPRYFFDTMRNEAQEVVKKLYGVDVYIDSIFAYYKEIEKLCNKP